ncbi:MAG: hypothetical protein ACOX5R_20390 [bacterium]|jgi:hypothetical protein
MFGQVEIYLIDDYGIFFRAFAMRENYFYQGNPEDRKSPLSAALRHYYMENAPQTILCQGFDTPRGLLYWESEMVTPYSEDEVVEIGEHLFLIDDKGESFMDEYTYELLSRGIIPEDWEIISRERD